MECKQAVSFMHDYLDGDLPSEQARELQSHLDACPECRSAFRSLEETEMMLFAANRKTESVALSEDATDRIMSFLPQPKKHSPVWNWVRRHPALTAAAAFILIMLGTSIGFWNADTQLVVKGSDLNRVQVEGNTVIVPEGTVVTGDLTVERGELKIYGDVEGNVTVIDGSAYQASTAHVAGQVKDINQAFDWVWYKLGNIFSEVAYR
ncbi:MULTISPECIES: zf-HC2 domain-containing protein [Saccharibacillus]|uniref:Anti-sigma-W factor RsiW n=1 Tax=Saccharibacillus brassicae TaxID=2583377 RepID=A0A4Y6UVW2_SACBS|nr:MULTISPECIES: zf-HC2 domain-containing protein [Saccharibacillus]MWJ32953.1 anti-sigma factor [Saccharibacillus sp. WB 17]QDH20698.1 anti-sigma factor [Saccharibacillus brassicae]